MPSQLHESHLLLFRNQPALAADLIRSGLGVELPSYRDASVISADLTELQPAEYRADIVIQLSLDRPVFGIVVEVQLSVDERKRFVWPAYVSNLRARLKCEVALLVVTADEAVARWAARANRIGGMHWFTPYVLSPSKVPEIAEQTDASSNPELAVLSAMAHGRDSDVERALQIAFAAQRASAGLDADRSKIYCDLIFHSLGEAARLALKNMDARKYEYQSDFARQYIAQGRAEGHAEGAARGRIEVISKLLALRFGEIDAQLQSRIEQASVAELDAIAERVLVAGSANEAVGCV
jgi:hypothetical protein